MRPIDPALAFLLILLIGIVAVWFSSARCGRDGFRAISPMSGAA